MDIRTIETRTHGRYLVDMPQRGPGMPLLVGFHGYAERAEDMLEAMRRVRGERDWGLVSIQALNRFYTRSRSVVANWMTREDRELAIADNVHYTAAVVALVRREYLVAETVVYVGFSQGVAMAYRAVAFAAERHADVPPAAGGVMLAGDVPPDVVPHLGKFPPLLIGRGSDDDWYTESKAAADRDHFERVGVTAQSHVFTGGHVWDDSFVSAAGVFLDHVARSQPVIQEP